MGGKQSEAPPLAADAVGLLVNLSGNWLLVFVAITFVYAGQISPVSRITPEGEPIEPSGFTQY